MRAINILAVILVPIGLYAMHREVDMQPPSVVRMVEEKIRSDQALAPKHVIGVDDVCIELCCCDCCGNSFIEDTILDRDIYEEVSFRRRPSLDPFCLVASVFLHGLCECWPTRMSGFVSMAVASWFSMKQEHVIEIIRRRGGRMRDLKNKTD